MFLYRAQTKSLENANFADASSAISILLGYRQLDAFPVQSAVYTVIGIVWVIVFTPFSAFLLQPIIQDRLCDQPPLSSPAAGNLSALQQAHQGWNADSEVRCRLF